MADDYVRIVFKLEKDEDDYPPVDYERLWARPRGNGLFEIDNVPFFARDISVGDIVTAREVRGEWMFTDVVQPSGSSTLRAIIFDGTQVQGIRDQLREMGCSTELNGSKLISVDIPAQVDLHAVRGWLLRQEEAGVLEFEDACIRHAGAS